VTRRIGWLRLTAGERLLAIEKGQGLRLGERVVPIRPIRVLSVRREPLNRMLKDEVYGLEECALEGFWEITPSEFVKRFCASHRCDEVATVTRVEFDYDVPAGWVQPPV